MATTPSIERRISELEIKLLPPPVPVVLEPKELAAWESPQARDRQTQRRRVINCAIVLELGQWLAEHGKRSISPPDAVLEQLQLEVTRYRLIRLPGSFARDNKVSSIKVPDSPWSRKILEKYWML